MKINKYVLYITIPLVILILGALSGASTGNSIATWYQYLNKPSWNPPNYLFGPVWTVLYLLMGVAFVNVLLQPKSSNRTVAIFLFLVQFAFNLAWSYIFFGLHTIGFAFVEILILLSLIIATGLAFRKVHRTSSYMLIPYIAWVSFASFLNYTIYMLN